MILGGCGLTQRWDVAVQRWEQWSRCIERDGVRETVRVSYDEFFERGKTDTDHLATFAELRDSNSMDPDGIFGNPFLDSIVPTHR